MISPLLAAIPLARNAVTFSCCHGSRSARTAMAILVSNRMVMGPSRWSHFDGPADVAQMLSKGQRGHLLPAGQVAVEPHLAAERYAVPDLCGLASFGVADGLGQREDLPGPFGGQEEHAIVVADDEVRAGHGPLPHRRGLQDAPSGGFRDSPLSLSAATRGSFSK